MENRTSVLQIKTQRETRLGVHSSDLEREIPKKNGVMPELETTTSG